MTRQHLPKIWVKTLWFLLLTHTPVAAGLGWPGGKTGKAKEDSSNMQIIHRTGHLSETRSRAPDPYDVALQELQQLESEPLCHRIAARLLVSNCQLLEGKDEATVLTDSGRKTRDFVDSYAASLAICDLERGNFVIPRECQMFREPTLTQLPVQKTAVLHVTSGQIDQCLSSLGTSDSAWNTWISYRHKALRFCEAARADNERAQNVLLFQRVTKIMSKLADDVDARFDERMQDLDLRADATGERIDRLSPQLDALQNGMANMEGFLTGRLSHAMKTSASSVDDSIKSAANLQKMLEIMLKGAVDSHAEAAAVHEQSLQVMNHQAESEIGSMMAVVAAAMTSTTSLLNQLELSRQHTTELEYRQEKIEKGMEDLLDITETLSTKYKDHANLLQEAQNMTNDILYILEDTASSAATVGDSFARQSAATFWWPYIWCPAASLVMGSYGLPPSALRNIGLVALGEVAGFAISSLHSLSVNFRFPSNPITFFPTKLPPASNTSSPINSTVHLGLP
ncbi:hypothetical protein F4778DRAFT_526207 [Xylariomycetidae sp. FL2044]|nr:hypothetical protein F4778DRAFT_526207 [Xylariomycetidae sp. FL2044]